MRKDIDKVIAAIDYIESHLSEKLDLEIVSCAVHYSKYYLHRIFTNTVGVTIHDYVQRRQLTEAAKLLIFSQKPIIEIALMAGYESQQAFTAIFKAMYKKSPGQYRQDGEFYPLQLKYILNQNPTALNRRIDWQNEIVLATVEDISQWIELLHLVIDGFPYLNEERYILGVREYIRKGQALILKDGNTAIGVMTVTIETGSIDFFGVHPQYRNQGIAQAFLKKALPLFVQNTEVTITTFRAGDKADPGQRNILKNLGFAEAELLVEFGYPTQRLVLKKSDLEGKNDG